MFKKIISNAPFCPSAADGLYDYSVKLRKEIKIRRLCIIFIILIMLAQTFILLEHARAHKSLITSNIWTQKQISRSIKAINITNDTSSDKNNINAKFGDKISFILTVSNTSDYQINDIQIYNELSDVVNYSTLTDLGGAEYNSTLKTISWSPISLSPGETQTRVYTVTVNDVFITSATSYSGSQAYDCIMTNDFGNILNISLECPILNTVVALTTSLPSLGLIINLVFFGLLLLISVFLYFRARLLYKEVKIIRQDECSGAL